VIVLAHPKSDSFCASMAKTYQNKKEQEGFSVEILDLYRCEVQQTFFTYEDANNLEVTTEMKYFQDKIEEALEIVAIHPNYWGGFPAILQNFIDWNFSKGFAFVYNDNGRPQGLLTNKRMKVLVTSGAPDFLNLLAGHKKRMSTRWKKQIAQFCGMDFSFSMYGGVGTSMQKSDKIFADIQAQATG
jgi:NAD(P)H dehydrogenase (quinone)